MTKTSTTVMKLDDRLRVAASPALFADLKALLGSALPGRLMVRRDPSRAGLAGRDAAAVLGVLLVVGVVCGVLWSAAGRRPPPTPSCAQGGSMGEDELSKRFAADGCTS